MQRLIDANKLEHEINQFDYYDQVKDASTVLTIPDNATIGDVIMGIIQSNAKFAQDLQITLNICAIEENTIKIEIGEKLWNAPYKRGTE